MRLKRSFPSYRTGDMLPPFLVTRYMAAPASLSSLSSAYGAGPRCRDTGAHRAGPRGHRYFSEPRSPRFSLACRFLGMAGASPTRSDGEPRPEHYSETNEPANRKRVQSPTAGQHQNKKLTSRNAETPPERQRAEKRGMRMARPSAYHAGQRPALTLASRNSR